MLKIGVLGAGHLGKIHIKLLLGLPEYELVGFYDPDPDKVFFAESTYGIRSFKTVDELIDAVDAVDIVTPTLSHYDCAKKAIQKGKHIFVEKPLSHTVEEAKELVALAKSANIKAQVGHVERFNPAFLAAQKYNLNPLFIEGHRLAEFKPRGTDVSVVLDLMIHDIDIILSMVKSPVSQISASGVAVISENIDIANARIEFENGCVANLTASRVSLKTERKLRIFQKNAYISIDFQKKETNVFQLKELGENDVPASEMVIDPGNGKPRKEIFYDAPEMKDVNAIELELQLFANAIINDEKPPVTIDDGCNALVVAHNVLHKIDDLLKKSNII
ncbi:MAG: Gfo/Idh/MocA family oxidoreductase [Sphingobacteriales bacterium]|nr:MAG: Gfo/Idh/MocA family oxidoreductase [Sphingobacteriales bacterium]